MGVRIVLVEGERVEQALKRLRKLLDRHGVSWEQRRRRYFVKPTQTRRAKRFGKRFKSKSETLRAKRAGEQPVSSMSEAMRTFWKRTGKP